MNEEKSRPVWSKKKAAVWVSAIATIVFIIDIASKVWAYYKLRGNYPIDVIPNYFRLAYAENTGIAFSLFQDQSFLLSIITPVAFIILLVLIWQQFAMGELDFWYVLFFGLIIGGALGNILNRLYNGFVVDFFDAYIAQYHWPTFNVADSALVVGQVILVYKLFFGSSPVLENSTEQSTNETNNQQNPNRSETA